MPPTSTCPSGSWLKQRSGWTIGKALAQIYSTKLSFELCLRKCQLMLYWQPPRVSTNLKVNKKLIHGVIFIAHMGGTYWKRHAWPRNARVGCRHSHSMIQSYKLQFLRFTRLQEDSLSIHVLSPDVKLVLSCLGKFSHDFLKVPANNCPQKTRGSPSVNREPILREPAAN